MQSETNNNVQTTQVTTSTTTNHAFLSAKFNFVKFIILTIITFGIYAILTYAKVGNSLNLIASRYDAKRTMNYWLLILIVAPITLGIGLIVWYHKMSTRVDNELKRRGINYSFGAGTFWLWNVLGIIIIVGPFIYIYKLFQAMNLLIEDYNING